MTVTQRVENGEISTSDIYLCCGAEGKRVTSRSNGSNQEFPMNLRTFERKSLRFRVRRICPFRSRSNPACCNTTVQDSSNVQKKGKEETSDEYSAGGGRSEFGSHLANYGFDCQRGWEKTGNHGPARIDSKGKVEKSALHRRR